MVVGLLCSPVPEPFSNSPAPTAPRTSANKSWLATQGRLPLAFMGLALVWLVVASGLLVAQLELIKFPHMMPPVISLTHAWMLGFFVTVACGAVYQLVPVALSTTLWNERLGWLHFGLHAVGVPGMVYFFRSYQLQWVGCFGGAVAFGILCFSLNTWITVKRSSRRDVIAWSILLATGWVLFTVLAGLFLVANRLWAWVPLDPLSLLRAHAHLGLIGFLVTLLQGVAFQLIPMFTMGEVRHWWMAKTGLWLSQLGLVALVPGFIWHWEWVAFAGALAASSGLIFSGLGLKRALATRKKRRLDPGLAAFLRGGLALCAAAYTGTALAWPGSTRGLAVGGFNPMIYALLGILGGLLPCVAGMMCKVVPFLTWMRVYGPRVGRGPTPPAHSLTHPRLEHWGLALQQFSTVPLLCGAWMLNDFWLHLGAWLLAAGVALFLMDMLGVLKHLWFPSTTAAAVPTLKPKLT